MAGGKASPRQKMINMMYLVLTALLAMNVSKEILNSFAILNNGLQKTNETFKAKNEVSYNLFERSLMSDPVKVRPYYEKAMKVKKASNEMYEYIEVLKNDVIEKVEQKKETTIEGRSGQDSTIVIASNVLYMEGKDNYNEPTLYFMGESDLEAKPGSKAYEFKEKIKKFKADMMSSVDEKDRADIRLGLDISNVYSSKEGRSITWESNTFYHNPAVAVISLLTKMQNDVRNAEADIVNSLYKRIDVASFKFDVLKARVIANSNYVLLGEEYKADVFLAAYSSTSNPKVWIGNTDTVSKKIIGNIDSTSVKVKDGIGVYTLAPSSEGTVQWGGIIKMKDPSDPKKFIDFPFSSEFKAARPAIVVSPDKMNVFYVGIDNPVSISVPGVAAEDIVPSMSGGSISGSRGKYNVRVGGNAKEAVVGVSAKTKSGVKSMGSGVKFRVKQVPNPVATVYGKRGSDVVKQGELQFIKSVVPMLDNFEFDLKFPVVSFDVSMSVNGLEVTETTKGGSLNDKQLQLIRRGKKGGRVSIENVKVTKPGGSVVNIGVVTLKII
jgi:gliding motility-associated protein GldM